MLPGKIWLETPTTDQLLDRRQTAQVIVFPAEALPEDALRTPRARLQGSVPRCAASSNSSASPGVLTTVYVTWSCSKRGCLGPIRHLAAPWLRSTIGPFGSAPGAGCSIETTRPR